jgi:hypothetical protein
MTTMTSDRGMTMGMGTMNMGGMMPSMMQGNMMSGMQMPSMGMMPSMMVPRCTMKMEKMSNGMRCTCTCDDKTSAAMLQNLCMMMANGMMGCCIMMNGQMVCCCNMTMGMCKVEMTDMGCVMTCTSGDAMCAKMIGCMCDCMMNMMMPGCTCYMMMNGMPMCCMAC